jgi:hypothetical protein
VNLLPSPKSKGFSIERKRERERGDNCPFRDCKQEPLLHLEATLICNMSSLFQDRKMEAAFHDIICQFVTGLADYD